MAAEHDQLLANILDRTTRAAPHAVVIFDLDSTLLDNRPRQVRIFRDFGILHSVSELLSAEPHHWRGWDLKVPLRNLGLEGPRLDSIYSELKQFWDECFFTSEYCRADEPVAGAAAYVQAIARAGAQIVYLTGRHEGMRSGTIDTLRRHGFPLPPGNGTAVHLIMKPRVSDDDDAFKQSTHPHVRVLGQVIAAFDNEPLHANDLLRSFPHARVVHLRTNHSGRAIVLSPGIVSIDDFREET